MTTLYHGTSAEEDFDIPDGPAWFSDDWGVAEEFVAWHPGSRPRILEYKVVREPKLFVWHRHEDLDALYDESDEEMADYWRGEQPWRDMETEELVEEVGRAGYDGWNIPNNYPSGADIVILYPEDFVELVEVHEEE